MKKIQQVERAKTLMTEAASWSVMKWLREKKNVRRTADDANAALDLLDKVVKSAWTDQAKAAYAELAGGKGSSQQKAPAAEPDSDLLLRLREVKRADDAALSAREEAEKAFDEAEKLLSTSMAREGCRKAIVSWDLHEKAIGKAEAIDHSGRS